ncbi:ankyrin [Aspergillus desertorum]
MSLADHEDMIRRLYIDENMTIDGLMRHMEKEYQVHASKDTYKRWLKRWELRKNQPGNRRKDSGKGTELFINRMKLDKSKIQKEIARNVSTLARIKASVASPATSSRWSVATPAGSKVAESKTPEGIQDGVAWTASASLSENALITVNVASGYSGITTGEPAKERKLLAETLESCGSFISLWARKSSSTSQAKARSSYSAIAEAIVNTVPGSPPPSTITSIIPAEAFHILFLSYNNNLDRLQVELHQVADQDFEDVTRPARFIAASKGCVEAAAALFLAQADITSRDTEGRTCLHLAALRNHPDMVAFLIMRGSDVNSRRGNGESVWTDICLSAEHETVSQLLIDAGANVNALVGDISPIYLSAAGGHTTDVALLLRRGVSPSLPTPFGWTSLVSPDLLNFIPLAATEL